VAAIDEDPHQALRAMLAQAEEIATSAKSPSDAMLRDAAIALGQRLATMKPDHLRQSELEPLMAELWNNLADETDGRSVA
jgi:hypothetical protein